MNTLHEKLVKYEAKRQMTDQEIFKALTGMEMPDILKLSDLHNASPLQLLQMGFTNRQAAIFVAAEEYAFRVQNQSKPKLKITGSKDSYGYINRYIGELSEESFYVIHLNRRNEAIGTTCISNGSAVGTVVDVQQIARKALAFKSQSVILAHNHPSGGIEPSRQDYQITTKLKDALKLLDIHVLDHIIVGDNAYYSFADNGNL
jgi:DNA repair protein RadC